MIGRLIAFFRDPQNQHLATWVQTMAVVIGVIIALFQLSSVLDESNYRKGETFLEYENEFATDISRQMGLIHEYHANRGQLSEDNYSESYPLDRFLQTRNAIEEFTARLSACGTYGVCPSEQVDRLVCRLSKGMHISLSRHVSWPQDWKIKFSEPVFYEAKINEHCDLLDRVNFWYLR